MSVFNLRRQMDDLMNQMMGVGTNSWNDPFLDTWPITTAQVPLLTGVNPSTSLTLGNQGNDQIH